MKILINKYKKYLITLLFPYIFIVLLLAIPTNKEAVTLGSYYEVGETSTHDDSSFFALYVLSYYRVTNFQIMIANNHELIDFYETSTSIQDLSLQGKVSKNSSLNQSYLASHLLAAKHDNKEDVTYYLDYIMNYNQIDDINVGNKITKVDNMLLKDYTFLAIDNYLLSKARLRDNINLTFDNKTHTVNAYDFFIGGYYPYYNITDFDVSNYLSNSGGPSAGLIYTLKMYTGLINLDLSNLRIAGTGSINVFDEDTITVGKIGGIKQKIAGLKNQNIDILFIPSSNYYEGIEILITKYIPNTKVYFVSTLEEAVTHLHENI